MYFALGPAWEAKDRIVVEGAEFADADLEGMAKISDATNRDEKNFELYKYNVYGHKLKPGKGVMLGFHFYSTGLKLVNDDELYEKVSVWIPELKPALYELSPTASVKAYYSKGGSAWPESGCSENVKSGTITIYEVHATSVLLEIRLRGKCVQEGRSVRGSLGGDEFHDFVLYRNRDFASLTPWLGGPGAKHPYQVTYR